MKNHSVKNYSVKVTELSHSIGSMSGHRGPVGAGADAEAAERVSSGDGRFSIIDTKKLPDLEVLLKYHSCELNWSPL